MFRITALAGALVAALFVTGAEAAEQYTVFAAASMKDALDKAAKDFEAANGTKIVLSFASTSVLAKQVEAGAPADAFVSADQKWMDYMTSHKLVKTDTIRLIARNDLVIAAAPDTKPVADAEAILGKGKFAMGDPKGVPAGRYGQAALQHLKLWDKVENASARRVLQYVGGVETVRITETINGRSFTIEVLSVDKNRWRAQILRRPGAVTALMPFYGATAAEAAAQLSQWLSRMTR